MNEIDIVTSSDYSRKWWEKDLLKNLSWQYKSCVYHRVLFNYLDIPRYGNILMLGCGYGMSLEILANQFPGRKVQGFDLYNYADLPLVIEKNVCDLEDQNIAYVYCNVGNFVETPDIRKIALQWSLKNLVPGGVCVTSGNHDFVENFLNFKITELASDYNCTVSNLPNDSAIEQMNSCGKYNSSHDCVITKKY